MQIRAATRDDAPAITGLINSVNINKRSGSEGYLLLPKTVAKVAALISQPGNTYLVAEDNKTVEGFVYIDHKSKLLPDGDAWLPGKFDVIEQIAVRTPRRGIGEKLYAAAETLAESKGKGLGAYVVTAPKFNTASLAFHFACGFEPVGAYTHQPDAVHYGLNNYKSLLMVREGRLQRIAEWCYRINETQNGRQPQPRPIVNLTGESEVTAYPIWHQHSF